MKLPYLTTRALAAELSGRLKGRKVTAVGRLEHGAGLRLSIGPRDHQDCLVLAARPQLFVPFVGRKTSWKTSPQRAGSPLEEHLRGSTVQEVACWRHDRIIRLELIRTDEIRGSIRRDLILELVPRRQNIILVDSDRQAVLYAWRRIDHHVSRVRTVLPGESYQPPPPPPGLHPGADALKDVSEALGKADGRTPRERFSGLFPWASPYLFDEILAPMDLSPDERELTDETLPSLWARLRTWIERLDQGPPSPTLVLDDRGRPRWLLPYDPRSLAEERKRRYDSLSRALEERFHRRIGPAAREDRKKSLLRGINLILHRRRRARKHLLRELEQTGRADQYHRAGVILSTHLSSLKKGAGRVTLTDPADPDRKMEIDLDPRLSPAENAQRYFKRARKAKAARPKIQQRIRRLDLEIEKLAALREDLAGVSDEQGLQAVETRLKRLDAGMSSKASAARSVSGRAAGGKAGGRETGARDIGRSYILPGDWQVLVGRNNRENDELTNRVARPDDLWLHAQGVPGSHVVIRRAGRKDAPGRRITELAAGLAAHFSRARHSGTVPVIVTQKRYVRKPRGAKPGMAVVDREKTLFVAPLSPEQLPRELEK
jgi:predicted ribosome quality control (RQC) complex YloA/Tae2 family protein